MNDFSAELAPFERYFSDLLKFEIRPPATALENFWKGMEYSLFGGGKRFRPLLSLLTAKALGEDPIMVYPLAAAVEMIHTYSLIHDDLPCLDNDEERRGRPTNHRVYGEDMALLAGDALQSLAFFVLAEAYAKHPRAAAVIKAVARAAGPQGMVGGQVLDMLADMEAPGEESLRQIHELKTGALIQVAVTGAALVGEASKAELDSLHLFGEHLGFAFQIADDIQDSHEGETAKNFVGLLGEEKANRLLRAVSEKAFRVLETLKGDTEGLRSLVEFNLSRL
jgi:geranylgeranyl diphosphate synthase type II